MTEETRSYNAIANENKMLHKETRQLREVIYGLEIAVSIVSQPPDNPHLKTVSVSTQTYQTPGSEVEVDIEFGRYVLGQGLCIGWKCAYGGVSLDIDKGLALIIEAYKAQQADSPTIDSDSD